MLTKAPLKAALGAIVVLMLLGSSPALGQAILVDRTSDRPIRGSYELREINVDGTIRKQVAELQISQVFHNPTGRTIEAELLFPLPDEGAVQDLVLMVNGKELAGELMSADEARKVYEGIVRKKRDPALLEYAGRGLFKTSVFPIPAGETREVTMRYTQLCRRERNTVAFSYPLGSHRASGHPVDRLVMSLELRSERPIKSIYSPTHNIGVHREGKRKATVSLERSDVRGDGAFRLFYDVSKGPVGTTVLSWRPISSEDGYFLMLASPGFERPDRKPMPKTVVMVLDKSGSMSGKKIDQAREAARFVLNNLNGKDTFNIIGYDSTAEAFKPELQRYSDETRKEALEYVDSVRPGGSTNIGEALTRAMSMIRDKERPGYVLFLTDGKPTAGERNEMRLAKMIASANKTEARLIAFGVGYEVNARLIDRLSGGNNGASVYVTPNQNLEKAVSRFYSRITAPVLADLKVKLKGAGVNRAHPREMGDLFAGSQLVRAGRYRKSGETRLRIRGEVRGEKHTFTSDVDLAAAGENADNSFIETVWASRRIGHLIDQIDLHGKSDERIDELVSLSKRYGILTPYTSFLAREDVELSDARGNRNLAGDQLRMLERTSGRSGVAQRQIKQRLAQSTGAGQFGGSMSSIGSGSAAFGRGGRLGGQAQATPAQAANAPALSSGNPVFRGTPAQPSNAGQGAKAKMPQRKLTEAEMAQLANASDEDEPRRTLRRVADRTFFFKDGKWVDSRLDEDAAKDAKAIEQFSDEYFELTRDVPDRLMPCLTFDEPVLVKLDGTVYRIAPPSDEDRDSDQNGGSEPKPSK